jgi:hypothetical protein
MDWDQGEDIGCKLASGSDRFLSIQLNSGLIQIFDCKKKRIVREIEADLKEASSDRSVVFYSGFLKNQENKENIQEEQLVEKSPHATEFPVIPEPAEQPIFSEQETQTSLDSIIRLEQGTSPSTISEKLDADTQTAQDSSSSSSSIGQRDLMDTVESNHLESISRLAMLEIEMETIKKQLSKLTTLLTKN